MAEYASDFDFIEDDSGGKFVPIGGPLVQLRGLYLYNNTHAALCIYRLFTPNLAERVRALSAAR